MNILHRFTPRHGMTLLIIVVLLVGLHLVTGLFSSDNQALSPGADVSRIYVVSSLQGPTKVTVYSPDGQQIGPTRFCVCFGIAVATNNKIYLTGYGRPDLITYDADWNRTTPVLNGNGAVGITVDRAGQIYLVRWDGFHRGVIRTLTPDGKPSTPTIETGLESVKGVAVDGAGKIYVVSQGNELVKIYNANGQETGPTIRTGIVPWAIAVGGDGKIYVANAYSVTTYLPSGEQVPPTIIARRDPSIGGIDYPRGLAVDGMGRVYVGYASGTVGIYNPDGKLAAPVIKAPEVIMGIAIH